MKYVPAPALLEIRLTHAVGDTMWDGVDAAGKQKAATQTYQQFLLLRTTDETFAEKKEGIELHELLQSARAQIRANAGKAVYEFEDEVAKRLSQAILHPKQGRIGQLFLEHNWTDWVLLWKQLSDKPPAVLNTEVPAPEKLP